MCGIPYNQGQFYVVFLNRKSARLVAAREDADGGYNVARPLPPSMGGWLSRSVLARPVCKTIWGACHVSGPEVLRASSLSSHSYFTKRFLEIQEYIIDHRNPPPPGGFLFIQANQRFRVRSTNLEVLTLCHALFLFWFCTRAPIIGYVYLSYLLHLI